ncbi:hypothetical protein JHK87_036476 [Glycine soja]|nr:hypothetical protein JHK87_036476 [Glycine soja]
MKSENLESDGVSVETIAATRIQTAFRAYKARKYLHRLRGFTKLKIQTQGSSAKKQAVTTITYLHSWSKIQAEIRARRICMVTEDRIRRKIIHSQLKLEAKIHDLEVTCKANRWNGVVVLKPRRKSFQGYIKEKKQQSRGKEPWHMPSLISRVPSVTNTSPEKDQNKKPRKVKKDRNSPTSKKPVSVKTPSANAKGTKPLSNAKGTTKARRRLSYPAATEKKAVPAEGKQ